ncbi:MAG: hypothetical protein RIS35_2990 [Pseudomonadota bacterium]
MPFATHDGVRLHWRADGPDDAPVLMLVGSLGSELHVWDPVVPALARRFRVVRMDKRGHGASDVPPGDYSMAQLGGDVLAVADAAGAMRFHYAGVSIGGMIGMWLAEHRPERLDRLVLSNTTAQVAATGYDERIATVRARGMTAVADGVIARWFTPGYPTRHPEHHAAVRQAMLSIDPIGYTGCCAAIRDMTIKAGLADIRIPTLVIAGTLDESTPAAQGRAIAEAIAGARLLELPTPHLSHPELPERFADEVTRFLLEETTKPHG